MDSKRTPPALTINWPSPIPQKRWQGFRRDCKSIEAFTSFENFKIAQQSELYASLPQMERAMLGRLLKRGQKIELDVFVRTHGANPIFDPQEDLGIKVGVAKADVIPLENAPSAEALNHILDGKVVHMMFQAGEASRFDQGPFYKLNPTEIARNLQSQYPELSPLLQEIEDAGKILPKEIAQTLIDGSLGPKQYFMIRAALVRAVRMGVQQGIISKKEAADRYRNALKNQKLMIFVSQHQGVDDQHHESLRTFNFFGFEPANTVTIEQELIPGIRLDEEGHIFIREEAQARDAAGHLYAMIQATRKGGFTTYSESGRPVKPTESDAFAYLSSRGGTVLNVIRINDMDRHTTEIINPKALSYALKMFQQGYVNVIEGVANPTGQKGGTGTTFGDPELHVLTETHENSFPALSRVFESAMKTYLQQNSNRHPAYNAMRQLADLTATRKILVEFGGRIVFVPRNKEINGESTWYLGVDMPMGDLSLLCSAYKSRMFQFSGPGGKELLIHDMKQLDQISIHLRTVLLQLKDPDVLAASREIVLKEPVSFDSMTEKFPLYGAPTPEFEANNF